MATWKLLPPVGGNVDSGDATVTAAAVMDAEAAFQKRGKLSSRLSGIFGVSPTVFCNVSPMGVMKVYSTLATSRGCCGPWLQSQWLTTKRQLVQAKRPFVQAKRQFVEAKRKFVQAKRQFVQGKRKLAQAKRQFVQRNTSHFYYTSHAKRLFVQGKRPFVQAKRQFVQGKRQFVQGKRQFVQRNPSHFYEDLSRETPVCARKVPFGLIKI